MEGRVALPAGPLRIRRDGRGRWASLSSPSGFGEGVSPCGKSHEKKKGDHLFLRGGARALEGSQFIPRGLSGGGKI